VQRTIFLCRVERSASAKVDTWSFLRWLVSRDGLIRVLPMSWRSRAHRYQTHTHQNSHRNSSKLSKMPTTDQIEAALAALALQDIPNYKQTAKEYGVCRTTLSRRHRRLSRSIQEARELQCLLSSQQQITLVNYINELSEAGIPPTPSMVRVFVFEISRQWPGEHWVARFVENHKTVLKSVYLYGFDLKRKRADNYSMVKKYFELIRIFNFYIILYL
jgi:transposase-like protein